MRWETTPLLEIEHLTMRFGGLIAVNNVTFDIQTGQMFSVIGYCL